MFKSFFVLLALLALGVNAEEGEIARTTISAPTKMVVRRDQPRVNSVFEATSFRNTSQSNQDSTLTQTNDFHPAQQPRHHFTEETFHTPRTRPLTNVAPSFKSIPPVDLRNMTSSRTLQHPPRSLQSDTNDDDDDYLEFDLPDVTQHSSTVPSAEPNQKKPLSPQQPSGNQHDGDSDEDDGFLEFDIDNADPSSLSNSTTHATPSTMTTTSNSMSTRSLRQHRTMLATDMPKGSSTKVLGVVAAAGGLGTVAALGTLLYYLKKRRETRQPEDLQGHFEIPNQQCFLA